jgi:hypothetical protein
VSIDPTPQTRRIFRVPGCPRCGSPNWKVDEEITVRGAIIVGADGQIYVDRAGGDPARLPDPLGGLVNCFSCDQEPDPEVAALVVRRARQMLADPDADWVVLEDYRQF